MKGALEQEILPGRPEPLPQVGERETETEESGRQESLPQEDERASDGEKA